tara:strand:- start:2319 stop:2609 length:291 start_codon:yes stop_codon:yes gene_type:complete
MKISKEKLKRIIKEELDLFEQEQPSDDKDLKTKNEFSKKFLDLSKQVRDVKNLDTAEMQIIMNVTLSLIKFAGSKSAGPVLQQIEDIVSKKIGAPQ